MIILKKQPFSLEEIKKLQEEFEVYIKTVIDIEKRICVAGMRLHFEGKKYCCKINQNKVLFGAVG